MVPPQLTELPRIKMNAGSTQHDLQSATAGLQSVSGFSRMPAWTSMKILFEDNHLIAVYKPAGLLTQENKSKIPSLMDLTKDWLKERYRKPGNVFLGLLHRLDKPVSGVVLFAKTSKAARRMSQTFRERRILKVYWALVEGVPKPKRSTLTHFLLRHGNRTTVYESIVPGSKRADLGYTVAKTLGLYCLCEILLYTGRKHQIRAQLAHIGHPVARDRLYGARLGHAKSIALMAKSLRFAHPVTKQLISVEVPDQCFWSAVGEVYP